MLVLVILLILLTISIITWSVFGRKKEKEDPNGDIFTDTCHLDSDYFDPDYFDPNYSYYIGPNLSRDNNRPSNYQVNNRLRNTEKRDDLYQLCPCSKDYICDHGICKKKTGDNCLVTSECHSDAICYNSVCTLKPSEWETPIDGICKDGLEVLDNNLMLLRGFKFILVRGFSDLKGVVGMCLWNGMMIIMTLRGLYRINPKSGEVTEIPQIQDSFQTQDTSQNKTISDGYMFDHQDTVYFLHKSKLYKLISMNSPMNHSPQEPSVKWVLTQDNLNGIRTNDGNTLTKKGDKYYLDYTLLRTIIRNVIIKKSVSSGNDIETGIDLTGNIEEIVRCPSNPSVLYYRNKSGKVYRYNSVDNKIVRIPSKADRLLVCNNDVWIITKRCCY